MSQNARSYLFDAGALFLYYSGNERIKPYVDRVLSSRASGFISEVNLAEFYYKSIEKFGIEVAETWYMRIRQSKLIVVPPDEMITRNAALWKSKTQKTSLADCYALATVQQKAQVLITTDPVIAEIKGIRVIHLRV